MQVNILGIDGGTKTGWGVFYKGTIQSGVQDFTLTRHESKGVKYNRFLRFLEKTIKENDVGMVFYEQAFFRGGGASEDGAAFNSLVQTACEMVNEEYRKLGIDKKVEYQSVPVGTVKLFWTGSGKSKKPEMIAEAQRRGFSPQDDNEADALAILHYGMNELGCVAIKLIQ